MRAVHPESRSQLIQELRTDLRHFHRGLQLRCPGKPVVSTGIQAMDELLPDRGLLRGSLSEWIDSENGSGATSLVMRLTCQTQGDGPLVVVDLEQTFYAPAIHAAGVCLDKVILVRPSSRKDALWAAEQSLRCPGIGAVVFRVDHLKTAEFRRLQLAAEASTVIGILIRPPEAQTQSGWSDVRLLVTPALSPPNLFRRRMDVRCVYAKGGLTDRTVKLELCDETGAVCLAAGVSHPATSCRAAET